MRKRKTMSISVLPEIDELIRNAAREQGITLSAFFRKLFEDYKEGKKDVK